MANTRIMIWFAFFAILYLNYEAWMRDYQAPASTAAVTMTAGSAAAPKSLADTVPTAPSTAAAPGTTPSTPAPRRAPARRPPRRPRSIRAPPRPAPPFTSSPTCSSLDIDLKGGEIERADLIQYPVHKDTPNVPVRLENRDPGTLYLLQTGLIGGAGEAAPTHLATWTSAKESYVMPAGANELSVPMTWTDGQGLTVTKTFVFKRGWYAIDLNYEVRNDSPTARSLASYGQILRHWEHASRSYFDVETYSFKGPDVFDGTRPRDLGVESEADSKFNETITNGWLASLQHHFVSAIVPPANQAYDYRLKVLGHEYLLSATGPFKQIPAGASAEFQEKLFVGPKLQSQLAVTGPRLERTADYGRLTLIAAAAVRRAEVGSLGHRQLGLGHHHRHGAHQADFLSLEPGERPLHGQDARRRAAHEADPGDLQGRPGKARPRHDGALQAGEDQPAGGLPADGRADTGVHLVLLGAARERGNAPGALHAVGQRSVLARSVLRAAPVDGRRHVRAVQAESRRRPIPCRPSSCSSCPWS